MAFVIVNVLSGPPWKLQILILQRIIYNATICFFVVSLAILTCTLHTSRTGLYGIFPGNR
uniref:Uncharacterized protein n=1 Tax=Anguilla anguilla TaxID=7936 RepID=A0A0E9XR59_ANGAN